MVIAFLYPTMFHPHWGGVERVADALAREFVSRGHRVIFIHNRLDLEKLAYDYPAPMYFLAESTARATAANLDSFHRIIDKEKVDAVINHCGGMIESELYCNAGKSDCRVISIIHRNPYNNYNSLFHEIYPLKNSSFIEKIKRLVRIGLYPKLKHDYLVRLKKSYADLLSLTDQTVLLSEAFVPEMKELNPLLECCAIPNPLPFDIPENISGKENIILWVGRMDRVQKRPDRMIEIWKRIYRRLPGWSLIMIGDGEYLNFVKERAGKLPRIQFTGFTDPRPYYAKARILCMTSSFEGFGMVLLEAMAYGCVPFAFDSFAAAKDLLPNPEQRLDPFNIRQYSDRLIKYAENSEAYDALVKSCRKHVEDYRVESIVDKWEKLLKK